MSPLHYLFIYLFIYINNIFIVCFVLFVNIYMLYKIEGRADDETQCQY